MFWLRNKKNKFSLQTLTEVLYNVVEFNFFAVPVNFAVAYIFFLSNDLRDNYIVQFSNKTQINLLNWSIKYRG